MGVFHLTKNLLCVRKYSPVTHTQFVASARMTVKWGSLANLHNKGCVYLKQC